MLLLLNISAAHRTWDLIQIGRDIRKLSGPAPAQSQALLQRGGAAELHVPHGNTRCSVRLYRHWALVDNYASASSTVFLIEVSLQNIQGLFGLPQRNHHQLHPPLRNTKRVSLQHRSPRHQSAVGTKSRSITGTCVEAFTCWDFQCLMHFLIASQGTGQARKGHFLSPDFKELIYPQLSFFSAVVHRDARKKECLWACLEYEQLQLLSSIQHGLRLKEHATEHIQTQPFLNSVFSQQQKNLLSQQAEAKGNHTQALLSLVLVGLAALAPKNRGEDMTRGWCRGGERSCRETLMHLHVCYTSWKSLPL